MESTTPETGSEPKETLSTDNISSTNSAVDYLLNVNKEPSQDDNSETSQESSNPEEIQEIPEEETTESETEEVVEESEADMEEEETEEVVKKEPETYTDKVNGEDISSAAVGVGQFMDPLTQVKEMYEAQGREFDPTKIKFDQNLQNELLMDLAKRKRGIDPSKELTKEDFDVLQKEWASFGTYYGQTKQTTTDTKARYDEILKGLRENQVKVPGDQAALPPSQYPSYNQRGSVNNTVMMVQMSPPQRSNDIPAQVAAVPGGGDGTSLMLPISSGSSAEAVATHLLLTSLTG